MNIEKAVIPLIESNYHKFTLLEKTIADFFIHNKENVDFSAKNIAAMLFVSEASLSRFSKKCGYSGYREFIYHYREQFQEKKTIVQNNTQSVLNAYQELIEKTKVMIDERQAIHLAGDLSRYERVIVGGMGSSGYAASEMELRFMQVGVNIDSIRDAHRLRMQSVFFDRRCLVIGMSLSGMQEEVLYMLKQSHDNGARTILMTASNRDEFREYCDEIILLPSIQHMEVGNVISPQFPFLIYQDILFSYYIAQGQYQEEKYQDNALRAIRSNKGRE